MLVEIKFLSVTFTAMVAGIPFYALVGAFIVLMKVAFVPKSHSASRECARIWLFLCMAQNM
jgi:type IV secretory pathway VirB3-like protein